MARKARRSPTVVERRKRSGGRRGAWLFVLLLAVLLAAPPTVSRGIAQVSEYRLKAAFLFNFAKFIEWPGEDADAASDFVLGIYGEDPFGEALDGMIEGKTVKGRKLVVRRCDAAAEVEGCSILFIGSDDAALIRRFAGRPILMVGEDGDIIENGGIVEFFMEDQRIRFRIHAGRAERAGLKISSKILRLATEVIKE